MNKKEIEDLRSKINNIDDDILSLLSERSKIVLEIGKQKKDNPVIDIDREQKILNRLTNKFKGSYPIDTIVRIWREIWNNIMKAKTS